MSSEAEGRALLSRKERRALKTKESHLNQWKRKVSVFPQSLQTRTFVCPTTNEKVPLLL